MTTLYRKYRPKNFSQVIGQTHIVDTLSGAIKNDRVAHAYLFTGPRGTGKTSIARILAKTVNCENPKDALSCEKCSSCKLLEQKNILDIIEIDAASNTGVDNIRELRETVSLPPSKLKYKVYIIDEVHMLSAGAFNALLKTLEEPPAHVIFILATTEIHKVPETIISRCQRFDFVRLPIENIIQKLSLIAKQEKIKIDPGALEMIALSAQGGMRDAESMLAQVISLEDKNITQKEVEEILGVTDKSFSREIISFLVNNQPQEAIQKINQIVSDGYDLKVFAKSLINYLRQLMLIKVSPELEKNLLNEMTKEELNLLKNQATEIEIDQIILFINLFIEAQNKISASILPQLPLEIAFLKAVGFSEKTSSENSKKTKSFSPQKSEIEKKISKTENSSKLSKTETKKEIETPSSDTFKDASLISAQELTEERINDSWSKILEEIKPYNHSLSALLLGCKVKNISGKNITLATPYSFHKERIENSQNKLTIEKVFSKILGLSVSVQAELDPSITPKKDIVTETGKDNSKEKSGKQNDLLNSAMEIFGGKIVE